MAKLELTSNNFIIAFKTGFHCHLFKKDVNYTKSKVGQVLQISVLFFKQRFKYFSPVKHVNHSKAKVKPNANQFKFVF